MYRHQSLILSLLMLSAVYRLNALNAITQTPETALAATLATTITPLIIFLVAGANFIYLSSAQFLAWSAFRATDSVSWT
jgi:hypothetical protein